MLSYKYSIDFSPVTILVKVWKREKKQIVNLDIFYEIMSSGIFLEKNPNNFALYGKLSSDVNYLIQAKLCFWIKPYIICLSQLYCQKIISVTCLKTSTEMLLENISSDVNNLIQTKLCFWIKLSIPLSTLSRYIIQLLACIMLTPINMIK